MQRQRTRLYLPGTTVDAFEPHHADFTMTKHILCYSELDQHEFCRIKPHLWRRWFTYQMRHQRMNEQNILSMRIYTCILIILASWICIHVSSTPLAGGFPFFNCGRLSAEDNLIPNRKLLYDSWLFSSYCAIGYNRMRQWFPHYVHQPLNHVKELTLKSSTRFPWGNLKNYFQASLISINRSA